MRLAIALLLAERNKVQCMLDADRKYFQFHQHQNEDGTGEVPDGDNVRARITYRVQLIDELDDAIELLCGV